MKRNVLMWLTAIAGILLAAPAFAQGTGGAAASSGVNWVALTSGFAMAIASAGCGYAQGKAASAACEGPGLNRIDGVLHVRHHLHQSYVVSEAQARERP